MSLKLAKFLISEFYENNDKYAVIEFFRRSPHGYLSMLLIYSNQIEKNELSLSDIYKNIPDKIASQLKIHNLINDAVDAGFLKKDTMTKDSRAVSITLADEALEAIKNWLDQFNEVIN